MYCELRKWLIECFQLFRSRSSWYFCIDNGRTFTWIQMQLKGMVCNILLMHYKSIEWSMDSFFLIGEIHFHFFLVDIDHTFAGWESYWSVRWTTFDWYIEWIRYIRNTSLLFHIYISTLQIVTSNTGSCCGKTIRYDRWNVSSWYITK